MVREASAGSCPPSLGAEEQGAGFEVGEELAWVRNRKVFLLLPPPFPFLQPPPLSLPSDDGPCSNREGRPGQWLFQNHQ